MIFYWRRKRESRKRKKKIRQPQTTVENKCFRVFGGNSTRTDLLKSTVFKRCLDGKKKYQGKR